MLPGKDKYLDHRYNNHLVRFLNVPGLRFSSMGRGYYRAGDQLARQNNFDAIVTYNPYPWHVAAARRLRSKYNIPWICLNLDFDDVGGGWQHFLNDAGDADGHVFLSYGGYQEAPVSNKLHLDSGVDALSSTFGPRETGEVFNIVYLGGLSEANGLELLLRLPEQIVEPHVRFIYGGKGYPESNERMAQLVKRDPRVDFRGFVNDEEVVSLFESADVFLNPRDPTRILNDMVFPSKIMHYLQAGKTVVSTWTKGLEESYRDLMIISDGAGGEDFSDALILAINESQHDRDSRALRILGFLEGTRLWSHQAERFKCFSEKICRAFQEKGAD
jgi:glycosyltransferase involved in cell wall biosynthesis